MYLCLNKLTIKDGKRIVPIFLYKLYKAGKKSFIIFLLILSHFSFVSNATNFLIHSLNWFILKRTAFLMVPFCSKYTF